MPINVWGTHSDNKIFVAIFEVMRVSSPITKKLNKQVTVFGN